MSHDLFQLRSSTVVEPLVDRWWAWSHLIAPAAASLHLRQYQLPALESYMNDPELHVRASQDPDLIGGAFVDIPPHRAGEVGVLVDEMKRRRANELTLACDLLDLSMKVAAAAHGQPLASSYSLVPESLKGCVELTYDYMHRGSVRVLEGLLSERHPHGGRQQLRIFEQASDGRRPFFMSTPRLPECGDFEWDVKFDDERVDALFETDLRPAGEARFRELLGAKEGDLPAMKHLLAPAQQRPNPQPPGAREIRLTHLGHASMLLTWQGTTILTDPFVSTCNESDFHSLRDLPDHIDYALVTHNHQDHFCLETLLRLRSRIGVLVLPRAIGALYGDVSLKRVARKAGFRNVVELDDLESLPIPDGEIVAVPFLGEHADLNHGKCGYVVRAGRQKLWFAADSDCLDPRTYEAVRKAIGRIETLLIGCESVGAPLSWTCGPLFPRKPTLEMEQTRRYHGANARTALEIAEAIGARRLYNYAMGLEPWMEFVLGLRMTSASPQWQEAEKLLTTARSRGMIAERPYGRWVATLDADVGGRSTVGWSPAPGHRNGAAAPNHPGVPIPASAGDAAARLASELGCGLPSVFLAAVCAAEARPEADCIRVAVPGPSGSAGEYNFDLTGDPSLSALTDRIEGVLAAGTVPEEINQAAFAFSFDGFRARSDRSNGSSTDGARYRFNHEGLAMHVEDSTNDSLEASRVERIAAILVAASAPGAKLSHLRRCVQNAQPNDLDFDF